MAYSGDLIQAALEQRIDQLERQVDQLLQIVRTRLGVDLSPQYSPVKGTETFGQVMITTEPGLVLAGNAIVAPVGALQGYTTLVIGSTTRKIPIYAV